MNDLSERVLIVSDKELCEKDSEIVAEYVGDRPVVGGEILVLSTTGPDSAFAGILLTLEDVIAFRDFFDMCIRSEKLRNSPFSEFLSGDCSDDH